MLHFLLTTERRVALQQVAPKGTKASHRRDRRMPDNKKPTLRSAFSAGGGLFGNRLFHGNGGGSRSGSGFGRGVRFLDGETHAALTVHFQYLHLHHVAIFR